jgi:hypothetical protein
MRKMGQTSEVKRRKIKKRGKASKYGKVGKILA